MIFSAINIGTNSTKALFAQAHNDTWQELSRDLEITGLGEGLGKTGLLSPQTMARTEAAVVRLVAKGRALRTEKIWVAGTAALRQAENSHQFQELLAKSGLKLEILSGQREAALSFAGLAHGLPLSGSGLAFDLGAGSLEIMEGESEELQRTVSLALGAGLLTEEFLNSDPPTHEELQAMEEHVDKTLSSIAFKARGWLVGVGGTVTALCQLAEGKRVYSRDLHGARLNLDQIEELYRYLSMLPLMERTSLPGFENPKRAKLAPAGAAVVAKILSTYRRAELLVSEAGILDGMMQMMAAPKK